MPQRKRSFMESTTGEVDQYIRHLFCEDTPNNTGKILLNIIKNDLTARQKKIIMLYYFKEQTIPEIAQSQGISHQAVSALISRARKRIFRYMQYYFK